MTEQTKEYIKSKSTDNYIKLEKKIKPEIKCPKRILIVSPTSNGCD